MTFQLSFDEKAIRQLEKLEKGLRERIFRKLQQTKEDPHQYFEDLTPRTDYKLRLGDHRVIADIYQSKQMIHVTKVGHRRNVYKL